MGKWNAEDILESLGSILILTLILWELSNASYSPECSVLFCKLESRVDVAFLTILGLEEFHITLTRKYKIHQKRGTQFLPENASYIFQFSPKVF